MQDGLLLVNKPGGLTSHDVISHLRRALKTKRLGHTGTLDPMATGVLPVLVGQATRLSQYLITDRKSYRATLCLGATTDTMDAEGQITAQTPVSITPGELKAVISSFVGPQMQLPPMYSAKKVGGKKLYELARQGVEIERQPCAITIYKIEIVELDLPKVVLDVFCSSGTYIRVLASDIGAKAGCGAYLTALERTSVGPFTLADSTPLKELEEGTPEEGYAKLLPMAQALYNLPQMTLDESGYSRIVHGNPVACTLAETVDPVVLLYHGEVIAIGSCQTLAGGQLVVQPNCVLVRQ